jgi:flagellar protein FliO/FliZ
MVIFMILAWIPVQVFAGSLTLSGSDTNQTASSLSQGSTVTSTTVVQMVVGLIFVIAAIVVLGWFSRRAGMLVQGGNFPLRILGSVSVGAREKVVLIEVGDKQILIGVAPGRVNKIQELSEPVFHVSSSGKRVSSSFFGKKLQDILRKEPVE